MRRKLGLSLSSVLSVLVSTGCTNAIANQQTKPLAAKVAALDGALELESAHVSYANGDLKEMGLSIKSVLFSNAEPEVKDNALKLLDRVYNESCDYTFPVDWKLPSLVKGLYMDIGRKSEPDGISYKTKISGHLNDPEAIQQIVVKRYPDTVIADKQAGIGEWELDIDEKDPRDIYFEIAIKDSVALKPGLYMIDITTKDSVETNGWFIVSDQLSSASPVVHTPSVGQHFTTTTPEFRWSDFRSPEYKPCESRRLRIFVAKIPSDKWDLRWSFGKNDPMVTSANVGTEGDGTLEPGKYWFTLYYKETRQFGEMELSRRSETNRQFYID
jgi:hypothetical protein